MLPTQFKYDKFRSLEEEKTRTLESFIKGNKWFVPVIQRPMNYDFYGSVCRFRDKSLEMQLDCLSSYFELKSDFIFSYLEPWQGVGIYASAFGCPFLWCDHDAPQTRHIYNNLDKVRNFRKPNIKDCEIMNTVLETVKYFREQTGDMLGICLTDTQSTNDNASLVMDVCEFFIEAISSPEELHPFLQSITDIMIEYTEIQIEALGNTLVRPGHTALSTFGLKGIALSDDNMAVVSPQVYKKTMLPYNNQISKHFGGLAIHTCGGFLHNVDMLLETEGLYMLDCAVGKFADPNPNDTKTLKEAFMGKDIVLKVRLGVDDVPVLENLLDKRIKVIVELYTTGDIDQRNYQYEKVKEQINRMIV